MRINRVTIKNFRIYKGEINVIFSDKEQNITIIAGKNGFGKTTFLTALIWGFYGRLLSEVDEKYKRDIYESGGYKKFANSILNRDFKLEGGSNKRFFVEIEISDIYIPSVPCRKIVIHREFDILSDSEDCKILIDGFENELTKEVGSDIFINDFILPREIAKFFFFDAEKIVSLAEISTNIEKQNLSKAYSEVLGINKYELLKRSLENLRVKLRKKSASISDRNRLTKFQDDVSQLQKLIALNESKISENKIDIERAKSTSEQYQEKLIREGNNMSVEEMIRQKKLRDTLQQQGIEIKAKLRELIELAPFAIAGIKLKELKNQVIAESNKQQELIDIEYIKSKFQTIRLKIEKRLSKANISKELYEDISSILYEEVGSPFDEQRVTVQKILLDMTPEESNGFISIYDNLRHSYSLVIKQIVKEERNNRIFLAKTLRKIADAESKDSDVLAKKYKTEKAKIDKRIKELIDEQNKLFSELGAYRQELSTKSKILSELTKTVSLDVIDEKKDEVTSRLIEELSDFIYKFKAGKKDSLQNRLRKELHQLMHKENFIYDVSIELVDDLIDIHLLDDKGEVINKETLSKGEQQLYATALLKSLVDESGIHFPVFIDSPLQKFDKEHSTNIISKFYPSISEQVVLFPLLEKELTPKEYSLLRKNVSQTFKIRSVHGKSLIEECDPNELFIDLEKKEDVHAY
jgi:DNA sulfur modification protein DndD